MASIKREQTVPYTPEQMYALVNRIEDYPEFLPWCSASEVFSRDEDEVKASVTVTGGGFHKSFTTVNRLQHNKMIEIRLVDGPFKHLEGFWLFQAVDEAQCKILLDLEFEFAGGILNFAFGPLFYQMASTFVDAFCDRAKKVYA